MTYRKKLIEVAMPLDAINAASATEKSIRHGHPSTLHLWWARRPLAAARSVLFGQLVDDPSSWPERFPTEEAQDAERQRLFRIIEAMVPWKNTNNEQVFNAARKEIAQSYARGLVADGIGGEREEAVLKADVAAAVVRDYLAEVLPPVHDPFAGGGSIPLEAQRLGLRAIATDLNPVAVMINKALIEIPPKFAGRAPVGPLQATGRQKTAALRETWAGARGLAEDVRRYGEWMREEAYKKIGHLYPKVLITAEMAAGRGDLRPYVGQERTVIAWLWARTVESPNPAFRGVKVPLVSNFFLSTKKGKETWVEPVVDGATYTFEIRKGKPVEPAEIKKGTKTGRGAHFRCVVSGTPIEPDYVKSEGRAGRMSARLMAVVLEGNRSRLYVPPSSAMEAIAMSVVSPWRPNQALPIDPRNFWTVEYGLTTYGDLFTARQLVALNTFSDLVEVARGQAHRDAVSAGWEDDGRGLEDGGTGATAYGEAVGVYLALGVSKLADYNSSLVIWSPSRDQAKTTFSRQALPMVWDYSELNPFAGAAGDLRISIAGQLKVIRQLPANVDAVVRQAAAQETREIAQLRFYSTDPPYYDNIGYADLSDFFYTWLRRSLGASFATMMGTMVVPKRDELVASPYRHGGKAASESFFLRGMTLAIKQLFSRCDETSPATIYYAFKQSELRQDGITSTGWETFLEAVMRSGFLVSGTWPVRTERSSRSISIGTNALASSVVLVCRKRAATATTITRAAFRRLLRRELPVALHRLQKSNIAPVDLAQASIGPGIAVFSRHARVLESDGSSMTVGSALQLIHHVMDELQGEDEGDLDLDSRFAITWFESHAFSSGDYGTAETLARARSVSVSGVQEAGIFEAGGGKARLLSRAELRADWSPSADARPTVWEATQHLIKRLDESGELAAAALLSEIEQDPRLARHLDSVKQLAYRLYTTCERQGKAEEAGAYNRLVVAWPELSRLSASSTPHASPGEARQQQELL